MRIGILVAREAVSLAGIFTIHADYYTLINKLLIPTGEIRSVVGMPLDFRRSKAVEMDMKKAGGNLRDMITTLSSINRNSACWNWRPR